MLKVDYEKTLVFFVDPQNGFSERCPDELPIKNALDIIPALLKMRKLGKYVGVSQDWHPDDAEYFKDLTEDELKKKSFDRCWKMFP